jgi:DNA-directed RNA polymerase subunit alpha
MHYSYLSDSVKIKKISDDGVNGVFDIEGLYPGYGTTMGGALRRVLLSSLPGAAVTQLRIKGVLHEFSTIPGVMEDVVEIGLNFKKLRFRFHADEPQVLTLKIKGQKDVTAADISKNAQVEIVNPDAHLFTMSDKKADVELEITVDKGLGYVTIERMRGGKLDVGVMALDAIFTPVMNVGMEVENMRVGDRTDFNRLTMKILTDGSITPSEAMHKAANILVDHFTKISSVEGEEDVEKKEE